MPACAAAACGMLTRQVYASIRLMFSIADIQNEQEGEFDQPEEGEEANPEEGTLPSYPIRCSVSITKVCAYANVYLLEALTCSCCPSVGRTRRAHC